MRTAATTRQESAFEYAKNAAVRSIMLAREEPIWFVEQILRHRALPGELSLADVDRFNSLGDQARACGDRNGAFVAYKQAEQISSGTWELDAFQIDLLNAIADIWRETTVINHERKTNLTVVSGHGPGKTHTAALIAHYFAYCWRSRTLVTAPKFDQVRTRLFAAIHKINMRAEPWYREGRQMGETYGYWPNPDGSRNQSHCILAETAAKPENIAGHHEPYQLVIVEEATGVTETLYPVIEGALSSGRIQILVLISNGTRRNGTFADSHLKPREAPHFFRYKINFANSRRVSRRWAHRLIDKYGAESPTVKVRVFGEFASDEPGQIITLQWIADAQSAEFKPDGSKPRRRISVDVAGGGVCQNVMTLCEHYQTRVWGRRQRSFSFPMTTTTEQTADECERLWKDFDLDARNGDDFVVDVIGIGLGLGGELLKRGYPVVMHQGGAASSEPKRWRNQRVQSYLGLRNVLRDKMFVFDEQFYEGDDTREDWEDLETELTAIRERGGVNADKRDDLETKQELVDRLGFSPDHADSLAMQWSKIQPQTLTGMQGISTGFFAAKSEGIAA